MSEQTPSQAEGERDDGPPARHGQNDDGQDAHRHDAHPDVPRSTPSQAEGERDEDDD